MLRDKAALMGDRYDNSQAKFAAKFALVSLDDPSLNASDPRRIEWISIAYPAKVTQAKANRASSLSVVVS